MKDRIPSVNEVKPGILVSHRYAPELGIVLQVGWDEVHVLLGSSVVVKWRMDGFRSVYQVVE